MYIMQHIFQEVVQMTIANTSPALDHLNEIFSVFSNRPMSMCNANVFNKNR